MSSPYTYCQNKTCPNWRPNNHCKAQHILLDEKGRCKTQDTTRKAKEAKEKKEQKQFILMGA